jgi:hypothetical protein
MHNKNDLIKVFFIILCLSYTADVFSLCNFNTSEHSKELNNSNNIESIQVRVPNNKKWSKNLLKIATSNSDNIDSKYKDNFKSEITVKYKFGICKYIGRTRVNGDWKDHIKFNSNGILASLDIKLEDGNIVNAIRFKLLLPHTRNSHNEVLGSMLLKELGFIAPETFLINGEINGIKSIFLFQENAEKEMLERNLRREGPIFEGNEMFLWSYEDLDVFEIPELALSKLTNDDWANKGITSSLIALNSYLQLQKVYLEYSSTCCILQSNTYLDKKFKDFALIMIAMDGSHGLSPFNRKFYFNVFQDSFEPIYYDGDLNLQKELSIDEISEYINYSSFFQDFDLDNFNNFIDKISNLSRSDNFKKSFLDRSLNSNFSENFFKSSFQILVQNLNLIANEYIKLNKSFKNRKLHDLDIEKSKYLSLLENNNINHDIYEVNGYENGKFTIQNTINENADDIILDREEIIKIISKNRFRKTSIDLFPSKNRLILANNQSIPFLNGEIVFSSGIKIIQDDTSKTLKIIQAKANEWALIKNLNLEEWDIHFIGKNPDSSDVSQQRFNVFGLTGCLNLYNVNLNNVNIYADLGHCEDSLNIINSSGQINSVNISNGYADAFDLDFSDIRINLLEVSGSGNDCLDVSGGSYHLEEIKLFNCSDKGISVGEGSSLRLNSGVISSSGIGISSKDLSMVDVGDINMNNVAICIEAMQKKQEFGGGNISINSLQCKGLIKKDDYSFIKIGNQSEL